MFFFHFRFCFYFRRPLGQPRTVMIDHATEKFRTFLSSASRIFKQLWMYYGHYGPEIGFCSCMAKHAWFQYPQMAEATYGTLGKARRMVTNFFEDFLRGFMESTQHQEYGQHRISNKIEETTADDYYDYQNYKGPQDYGPSRRIGQLGDAPNLDGAQNLRVIEKADPKLISVVEMLKTLQPKANHNDSFIIRYGRALDSYSQKIYSNHDDVEEKRSVSEDKIKKYPKKYQQVIYGESVDSPVNGTEENASEGRNLENELSANRRVLVRGVPPGLPSFDELPPADCKSLTLF